jgi:hypothetical protein
MGGLGESPGGFMASLVDQSPSTVLPTPSSKTPKKRNNKIATSDVFSLCLIHICVELVLCI